MAFAKSPPVRDRSKWFWTYLEELEYQAELNGHKIPGRLSFDGVLDRLMTAREHEWRWHLLRRLFFRGAANQERLWRDDADRWEQTLRSWFPKLEALAASERHSG